VFLRHHLFVGLDGDEGAGEEKGTIGVMAALDGGDNAAFLPFAFSPE